MNNNEINYFLRDKLLEYLLYRLEWRENELKKINVTKNLINLKNKTPKEKEDVGSYFQLKNEISLVKKRIKFEKENYGDNKDYPVFIGKTTFKKIIDANLGEEKITPKLKNSNKNYIENYLNYLGTKKYFTDGSIIYDEENNRERQTWVSGADYKGRELFMRKTGYVGDNISLIEWMALKEMVYLISKKKIKNAYILSDSFNNINNFINYNKYILLNKTFMKNELEKRYKKIELINKIIKELNINVIWIPRDINKADKILRDKLIDSKKIK